MATAHAGTTMAADSVDFIDENDARGVLLGLFEHVANTAGTDTDEHLDEVGTGNGEERHLGFTGNSLGQQGLTGTGRANHQHATGDAAAQALELAWVAQELDQLTHFFLGFVAAGHIGQRRLDLVF
ncbi:hypothetical protein D3C84_923770 [compost metagenome]